MKINELLQNKKIIAIFAVGIVAGVSIYFYQDKKNREASLQATMDSLKIEFTDGKVEYGTKVENAEEFAKSFIKESTGELEIAEADKVDTTKVGEYTVNYTLSMTDKYGQVAKKLETLTVTVEDTKLPEITLKSDVVKITEGDKYDPKTNVESVVDEVDGELEYELENQVDTSKVGEYTVAIKTKDHNGNSAEKSFVVNVNKKPVQKQYTANRNTWNAQQNNNTAANTWTANTNTGQQSYQNNGGNPSNNGGTDMWDINVGNFGSNEVPQDMIDSGYSKIGHGGFSGITYDDGSFEVFD